MRRAFPVAAFMCVIACFSIAAQPPEPPGGLRLPSEVKVGVGRLGVVAVETSGKVIRWRAPDGLDVRTCCEGRELLVCSPKAGRFTLLAFTAIGEEPIIAECLVIVGDDAGPGPGPPKPTDPLAAELQALYAADPSPTKSAALAALLDLYRAAADAATDVELKTAGELMEAVARLVARTPALTPASGAKPLWPLRQRLGAELNRTLPSNPTEPLTEATRKQVVDAYAKLAKALETIKP